MLKARWKNWGMWTPQKPSPPLPPPPPTTTHFLAGSSHWCRPPGTVLQKPCIKYHFIGGLMWQGAPQKSRPPPPPPPHSFAGSSYWLIETFREPLPQKPCIISWGGGELMWQWAPQKTSPSAPPLTTLPCWFQLLIMPSRETTPKIHILSAISFGALNQSEA